MPIPPRCSITEFVNSNCTAFVASFHRTSALSFTELSPHPSPSPSVDLCSICALVQIFYCFLCTSQNSFSLAEHSCAPFLLAAAIQCTSRELLNPSDVSCVSEEPVCRKDRLLIDIGTVYRVISSFTGAEKFGFIESVRRPDLLFEFPVLKETFRKQRKFRHNHCGS